MSVSHHEYLLMKNRVERNKGKNVGIPEHEGPEADLQKECELILYRNGIFFYHIRKAKHEKSGVPDLLFPNPFDGGLFYAVELKNNKEKLKKKQQETIRQIQANKGKAFVCRSVEEFRNILQYGKRYPNEGGMSPDLVIFDDPVILKKGPLK